MLLPAISRVAIKYEERGTRNPVYGVGAAAVSCRAFHANSISVSLLLGLSRSVPRRFVKGLFEDGASNKGRGRVRRRPVIPRRGGRVFFTEFERQLFTCSRATRLALTRFVPVLSGLVSVRLGCRVPFSRLGFERQEEDRRDERDGGRCCGEPSPPVRRSPVSLFAASERASERFCRAGAGVYYGRKLRLRVLTQVSELAVIRSPRDRSDEVASDLRVEFARSHHAGFS